MQAIWITLFFLICLYGCVRPMVALALLLYLFPIEQILQSMAPALGSTPLGGQLVNYVVGLVVCAAAIRTAFTKFQPLVGLFNGVLITVLLLYGWSIVTLLWSPGRMDGLAVVGTRWPYLVVMILGSYLINDLNDLVSFAKTALLIGLTVCVVLLSSGDFESKFGRLGIVVAGKLESNPLALGELGGIVLLTGALLRDSSFGRWNVLLRLLAVGTGAAIALRSGARGQLLFSVGIALVAVPLAAPMRSWKAFFSTILIVGVVIAMALVLSSTLLEGFAAKRFSVDEMLYGSSSTSERVQNVTTLMSHWLSSPFAVLVGLGYYAFSSYGMGIDYSHVVAADALFELGIPGAAGYIAVLVMTFQNCKRLMRAGIDTGYYRAAVALCIGILGFYYLLSNKQGELWGCTTLFMLMCIVARLVSRIDAGMVGNLDTKDASQY